MRSHNRRNKALLGIALGLLGFAFFVVAGRWSESERERLSKDYGVPRENVVIDPMPHGCDYYEDASLGNKHCHYEKVVDTEKACGADSTDCKVIRVFVRWRKVEE
jgi:hypothetical protein